MDNTTMDTLEIKVESKSKEATTSLDSLIKKLGELNTELSKVSTSTNNFDKLKQSMKNASGVKFKADTTQGVVPHNDLAVSEEINSQLAKLGKSLKGYDLSKEFDKAGQSIQTYKNKIGDTITVAERYNNELSKITVSSRSANKGTTELGTGMKNLKSYISVANVAITGIIAGFMKLTNKIGSLVSTASEYTESLNLFTVTMGDYAEEGLQWVNKFSDALYLDPSNVMQYMGSFNSLIKGFGTGSDLSYLMAQNLTQLTYDLASFKNLDFETSYQKLMSAISGEIEPLRNVGVALSENTLQHTLNSLGIQANVRDLNEAQKAQLRYIQIMRSSTEWQTDMGATLMSPANALRVVKQQFLQLGRAIGNVFIPILMAAIPYVIALTEILMSLAKALANLMSKIFGIKLDFSAVDRVNTGLGGISSGIKDVGDSAGKASKKINTMLAPFDDLNVVQNKVENAGKGLGGLGGGAGDLGVDLPTYDALANLTDKLRGNVEKAKKQLKALLVIISAIGGALLAWKLAKGMSNFFSSLSKITNQLAGVEEGAKGVGTAINKMGLTKLAIGILSVVDAIGGIVIAIRGTNGVYENLKAVAKQGKITGGGLAMLAGDALQTTAGFTAVGAAVGSVVPIIGTGLGAALGATAGVFASGIAAIQGYRKGLEELAKDKVFGDLRISVEQFGEVFSTLKSQYANTSTVMDDVKAKMESLGQSFATNQQHVLSYIAQFSLLPTAVTGSHIEEFKAALQAMFDDANNIIATGNQTSLDLWSTKFTGMTNMTKEQQAEMLQTVIDNNNYVSTEMSDAQTKVNDIIRQGLAERGSINAEELAQIQEQLNRINGLTITEMSGTQADIEYYKALFADKNLKLDEQSYKNYQEARKKYEQERREQIKNNYTAEYSDLDKQLQILEQRKKNANATERAEIDKQITAVKSKQKAVQQDRIDAEKELEKELKGIDDNVYKNLKQHYKDIERDTSDSAKKQRGIMEKVFKDAKIDTSDLKSQFKSAGNICAKNFRDGFNNGRLTLKANPNSEIGFTGGSIKFTAQAYESGGYPTSGDLFFANENGVPEMVGRIGTKAAVANKDQISTSLTNALITALDNYGGGNNQRPIYNTVYIGKNKAFEGYGEYIESENDRYGTNTIRI